MFGRGNISVAPPGVTAVFEAVKSLVERVHEACASLQQSASIGNETSKFIVEEHWRAQQLSHFRSREDTVSFFTKAFNQSKGQECTFAELTLTYERMRVLHDQNTRLLLSSTKISSSISTLPGAFTSPTIPSAQGAKFKDVKVFEDCKQFIRSMVLKNPIQGLYIKSAQKYVVYFCSLPQCPVPGTDVTSKIAYLESFSDGAGSVLQKYNDNQIDWLKKKIKCIMFGHTGSRSIPAPMLECDDSDLGNFHAEEQKNLFARSFLEQVIVCFLKFVMKLA